MSCISIKFGKQRFDVDVTAESTLGQLKAKLAMLTQVLPERQKLFGLKKGVTDEALVAELGIKKALMLMGTPEAAIDREKELEMSAGSGSETTGDGD